MALEMNFRLVKVGDDHWVGTMTHTGLNYENKVETKPVSKRQAWGIIRAFAEEQLGLVRSGRPKGGRRFGHRGKRRAIVDFVIKHGTVTIEEMVPHFIPEQFADIHSLALFIKLMMEDKVLKEWTDGETNHITVHPDHRHVLGDPRLGGKPVPDDVAVGVQATRGVDLGLFHPNQGDYQGTGN